MSRSIVNQGHSPRIALALTVAALLAGCTGDRGPAGTTGDAGTPGTSCSVTDNHDGTATIHCTDGTSVIVGNKAGGGGGVGGSGAPTAAAPVVDYNVLTDDEKSQSAMTATINNVAIPADGRPEIALTVTERHGYGVKNLTPGTITWRFALLALTPGVNGSADDTWVSYLAPNDHTSAGTETATTANLADNADGTYVYKLATTITAGPTAAGTTYDPAKVHRLIVLLYAANNPFAPINLVKDFVPATGADVTGQNEKVDGNACLECHSSFRAITGGTGQFGSGEFHGGVRYDVRTCVACHNDQRRFTSTGTLATEPTFAADLTWTGNANIINGEAVLDLPVFIHKIHMGDKLTLTGGTYAGVRQPYETTYPQDVRNCAKCHRAPAPMADNWHTKVSRRACGACHDGWSFEATPPPGRTAHQGGAQATDANCATCHTTGGVAKDVATNHLTVSPPNPHNVFADATAAGNSNTNAAYVAAAGAVPPGAHVPTYEVKSVSTWTDTANGGVLRPQIVFKLKLDGADVVFPDPATASELIPGFVGAPSAVVVFAVPQDGKTMPADFNAQGSAYIRNVWNGTGTCSNAAATTTRTGAGVLTGPDAAGFYTIQLTCVIVPANATMLSGGIGYTYSLGTRQSPANPDLDFNNNTQPLTEIDLPAYPYVPNKKADGVTAGYAGQGGLIVPAIDVSVAATGYTGRRKIVDNSKCGACHVTLGVGPDFHAGQRNDAPTCSWCHRNTQTASGWSGNAKDFVHSIHGAEMRTNPFTWHEESPTDGFFDVTYPGVLNKCEMCHLAGTYDFSSTDANTAYPNMLASTVGQGTYAAGTVHSPFVTEGTAYGSGFSFNALTGVATEAAPTTLVVSPIVAACSACHDSAIEIDHMQTNGGSFYEARSVVAAKPQQEECLLCHGPGKLASIADRHAVLLP